MNRKRLRILCTALRRFSTNEKARGNARFNLTSWVETDLKYEYENPSDVLEAALAGKNYCGTTACACGLATIIPSFKRDGLRLTGSNDGLGAELQFKRKYGYDAAAAFFDINSWDARKLFSPLEYTRRQWREPMAVVERIERMLAGEIL